MVNVVEIRLKKAGKLYQFDPVDFTLEPGHNVVVETARGLEVGRVVNGPREIAEDKLEAPLKPVVRMATEEDIEHRHTVCRAEAQAMVECQELVVKLNLPMKCLAAEYNLDESHVTIYFSSEGRVDFRELVRELGRKLRIRVELRQVGPRDETKLLGGYGRCGRELCCVNYLVDFAPVSIKMAKEQNLPLNPVKISGVCGRLLCCLGHEYETYKCMNEERARAAQAEAAAMAARGAVAPSNRPVSPEPEDKIGVTPITEADDQVAPGQAPAAEAGTGHKRRRRRRR
ncbi:Cell fate regulator YaaT, PSP1 superfamily (controls sporulation, competence, biofilm development) [Dehalogenimonas formicexedens]|uniref:Cell fate regulator YaaT, PSP1 superfamily (Controls sporulation, competence, biofilm development) n=1 Tax=Dehalogenimonas formicexedens TaxID=1839801 RepID=A0A1P8F6H6_9CHLR|nr:regulatory iron-sulfur-containing complex subunit RicT [Dehalogenimonas formicexedens]APV44040.1 Cell fate regulator YaaT, PSP1 superfamily (controls sporulation, competence, biofilm development) [Dehalogenimonas formicexedens]